MLTIGSYFVVSGQVLLPHMSLGDYFKIIEIKDWHTKWTYTVRRCNGLGKIEPVSRPIMINAEDIDCYLALGKLCKIDWEGKEK